MLISKKHISPVLLSIGFLISSCASGPSIFSDEIRASKEIAAPTSVIKANVGIYYVPSFANYVHLQSLADSIHTTNVGQESVGLFNIAIPTVFEQTALINKLPPYDLPKSELDGIVEPRLDYVSWRMQFDSEQEFFHVAYTFIFYTSQGVPISTWTIVGEGDYLKDQLADAAQKFVDGFQTSPETKSFREYLENKRIGKLRFDVNDIKIKANIVEENELGLKLKEAGILPVQVRVKNESSADVTGRGFDVRLIYADGKRLAPAFPSAVVSSFEYQAAMSASDPVAAGTLLGLPGFFGTLLGSHSERVKLRKEQASYFEKARLKEVTLASGESIQKTLYFILPRDVTELKEATLSIWLIDPSVANGARKTIKLSGIDYKISEVTKSAYKATTNIYAPIYAPALTTEPVNFTGDFSGTYVGLTPEGQPRPNSGVRIIQDGNKITGSFGYKGARIWGDIREGNTIKFDYSYPTGGSGVGKWQFTPGSSEVIGTWESSTRSRSGKWNLRKIE
jgi:hypothetical protein